MYDINKIPERIKKLRKTRWAEFLLFQKRCEENNVTASDIDYKKYECCKNQEELALQLGVERRSVGRWERGKSCPTIENLISICELLDCSMDYLLGCSGDLPEIDPIVKASHYSGISAEIIRYGIENPDYLDCLNFFMQPENCKAIFNHVTLSAWKSYWIDSALVKIKSPFKEQLIEIFNEYNATTPFNEINKKSYEKFLRAKFPKNKKLLMTQKTEKGIKIKGCFDTIDYSSFFQNSEFDYDSFIKYLTENTFEPLSYNAMIEIQKSKLGNLFCDLFTQYLEELN